MFFCRQEEQWLTQFGSPCDEKLNFQSAFLQEILCVNDKEERKKERKKEKKKERKKERQREKKYNGNVFL